MDPPLVHGGLDLQWTAPYMRVLRDPDDNEQDESFRWAPAPEKATV
jgi:hypothetical protein